MNPLVDDLLHQAETLSADDLELLLDRLMRRVVPDPGVDAAWKAEEAVAHYSAIAPKIGDTSVLALPWGLARRHESGPAD